MKRRKQNVLKKMQQTLEENLMNKQQPLPCEDVST